MSTVGYGLKFYYGSADTSTNAVATTEIARIKDFTPGKERGTVITVKYHNLPGNRAEKIVGPLVDTDDIQLTFNYDTAGYTTVRSLQNEPKTYMIKYPDFSTETFQGVIYEVGQPTSPQEEEMTFDVTLAISGDITFATATA